jgi:hypothetical protein
MPWERDSRSAVEAGLESEVTDGAEGKKTHSVIAFKSYFLISLGITVPNFFLWSLFPVSLALTSAWIAMFIIGLIRYRWRGLWQLITAPLAFYWAIAIALINLCDPKLGPCM